MIGTPTRGLPNRRLVNSQTGQVRTGWLMTGQLADAAGEFVTLNRRITSTIPV